VIEFVDEVTLFAETGKLLPLDSPVHKRSVLDGKPVCWSIDDEGAFVGSRHFSEVTCEGCLKYKTK